MARLLTGAWQDMFLHNGDSIVLPMILQSFSRQETFEWVFSSQLFFFPEIPLYAVSALFAPTPQAALAINAGLNLVLLYGALRWVGSILSPQRFPRHAIVLSALLCIGLFAVFVVLERDPVVNSTAMATFFLLTTYYSGSVLSGLAVVSLSLWMIRNPVIERGQFRALAPRSAAVFAISWLTATSNPLFLLQIAAPLAVTLLLLLFMGRVNWIVFSVVVGVQAVAAAASLLTRRLLVAFYSTDVAGYVRTDEIPASMKALSQVVLDLLDRKSGTLKLVLLVALMSISAGYLLVALYAQARPQMAKRFSTTKVFIASYVSITVVVLLLGYIVTGSTTTRYLIPLFIIPLLGGVALLTSVGERILRRWPLRANRVILSMLGVLLVLGGAGTALSAPRLAEVTASEEFSSADCLDSFLAGKSANGVASFWSSRPMELYGSHTGVILQVYPDSLSAQAWMINMASFVDRDFSYVVVDGTWMTAENVQSLGKPAAIHQCGSYDIYDYEGTEGKSLLTGSVQRSVLSIRTERGFDH
ncbi:hypothetical protein [Cryobacterium arcticum]|uniref:hypothetical protein n=1 Tax=Cryobacterium arcticum TaxID=670052 RepID=UPI0012EEBFC6|nr:hypothetical protein [Cryobacterium arcticum]